MSSKKRVQNVENKCSIKVYDGRPCTKPGTVTIDKRLLCTQHLLMFTHLKPSQRAVFFTKGTGTRGWTRRRDY